MSVYSGFATRQQETQYFKHVVSLIKILQRRIVKFYHNEPADEDAFQQVFQQTYNNLSQMEQNKYIEPFFSFCLSELRNLFSEAKGTDKIPAITRTSTKCTEFCLCACHTSQKDLKATEDNTFLTTTTNKPTSKGNLANFLHTFRDNKQLQRQSPEVNRHLKNTSNDNTRLYSRQTYKSQRFQHSPKQIPSSQKEPKQSKFNFFKPIGKTMLVQSKNLTLKNTLINNRSPYNRTTYSLNINGKKYKIYKHIKQIKIQSILKWNEWQLLLSTNLDEFYINGN